MTVGQRIQEHRKKNGLSQEELGQRLLVSRQTVSLWEKDQTLPTVDNLLLLKEIFGISVDELLGVEKVAEEENPPLEKWEILYQREPLAGMFRRYIWARLLLGVFLLFFGISVLWDGYAFLDRLYGSFLLLAGCAFFVDFAFVFRRKKSCLRSLPGGSLELLLYEGELLAIFSRDGKRQWESRIPYGEIEKVHKDLTYYMMYHQGKEYLIPHALFEKGEYDPESRLEVLLKRQEEQSGRKKAKGLPRVISLSLCVLAYLEYFLLIPASDLVLMAEDPRAALIWTMIPAMAIPVGCVAAGLFLLFKNKKGLHNLIVGVIVLSVALRFGVYMPGTIEWHEKQQATTKQEIVDFGIELPPIDTISQTYEGSGFVDGVAHFSTKEVFFKDESCKEFEKDLAENSAWMTEIPAELIPISLGTMEFHYLSIYNITTGEFNKLPEESGTYQFLRVAYLRGGFAVMDWYAIVYEADPLA